MQRIVSKLLLLSGIPVSCEDKNNLSPDVWQVLAYMYTGAVFTLQWEWTGDFPVRDIFVLDFSPHLFYIMADLSI